MRAGLVSEEAAKRLRADGENVVAQRGPPSVLAMVAAAVFEPFNGLMLVVAILTACPPNSSYPTFALIMVRTCLTDDHGSITLLSFAKDEGSCSAVYPVVLLNP
jgi:hypothetical protein